MSDATSTLETAVESATAGEPSDSTAESSATATPTDPTSTGSGVDCSGSSCAVTLSGDGAEVDVLGTTITLGQVQDGRATIGVAGRDVSCSEGEGVSAGPLTVECTTISPETVTLTASLG